MATKLMSVWSAVGCVALTVAVIVTGCAEPPPTPVQTQPPAPVGTQAPTVPSPVVLPSEALFGTNSFALTESGFQAIDDVVSKMDPAMLSGPAGAFTVVVRGYTDGVGTSQYNLKLSELRAGSVSERVRIRFAQLGWPAPEVRPVACGQGGRVPVEGRIDADAGGVQARPGVDDPRRRAVVIVGYPASTATNHPDQTKGLERC